MANKIFSSYSSGKNKDASGSQQLVVEIAADHVACMVKSGSKKVVKDFELFKRDSEQEQTFEEAFGDVLIASTLLNKTYDETRIFIQNESSVLIPAEHFNQASSIDYLNLVVGESGSAQVFSDELSNGLGIVNVYRIPVAWLRTVNKSLKSVSTRHSYSKIVEQALQQPGTPNDLLKVIFYEKQLVVVLLLAKKLKLIQTFPYESREDVLYTLLNISQRFNFKPDNIPFVVSGMADIKSSLFVDLKKYFKRFSVEEMNNNTANINIGNHPKHYLTPFINLAQ